MPRNPQAQAGADAWSQGYANSGAKLEAGVNRVTESPTVAAARQLAYYRQRILESLDNGHTERALLNSPLADWKGGMLTKAKAGLSGAATRGKQRYGNFASSFYPAMAQASQQAAAIDKSTREGKLARVAAAMDAAIAWKQSH
jgi:hypothetical protein